MSDLKDPVPIIMGGLQIARISRIRFGGNRGCRERQADRFVEAPGKLKNLEDLLEKGTASPASSASDTRAGRLMAVRLKKTRTRIGTARDVSSSSTTESSRTTWH